MWGVVCGMYVYVMVFGVSGVSCVCGMYFEQILQGNLSG